MASPNSRTTSTEIISVMPGQLPVDAVEFQKEVMNISLMRGTLAAAATAAVSAAVSAIANKRSHFYQTKMAPSARLGIPLMASMFVGSVVMELTMVDAHRNPGEWGIQGITSEKATRRSIPIHHWLVNRVYDSPFYFVGLLGTPLAGHILYTRMKQPHLTISQAALQSRVMAQGGVLSIVLSVMAARYYVEKNGRFDE